MSVGYSLEGAPYFGGGVPLIRRMGIHQTVATSLKVRWLSIPQTKGWPDWLSLFLEHQNNDPGRGVFMTKPPP